MSPSCKESPDCCLDLPTLCILIVSEVAMESSPGPSTSSGSRPEADQRAQSSAANTPRAGTHSKRTKTKNQTLAAIVPYHHFDTRLFRYAVYPPEGSSVKVNAKLLEESHPGPCLFWWYSPRWVIGILFYKIRAQESCTNLVYTCWTGSLSVAFICLYTFHNANVCC